MKLQRDAVQDTHGAVARLEVVDAQARHRGTPDAPPGRPRSAPACLLR
jgi:hypothetical protein